MMTHEVDPEKARFLRRKDQCNFITSLKNTASWGGMKRNVSEDQKRLLVLYQSLKRFDVEKTTIIAKWKSDRSCNWMHKYAEQRDAFAFDTVCATWEQMAKKTEERKTA
eukprot:16439274-Heterocapsa_arctica.AAC.1